jgi:EAL and modified HD-GYP domain-containing signal transduction protein
MNHSEDTEATIKKLGHYPCFSTEQLYDACTKATIFVEETESHPN